MSQSGVLERQHILFGQWFPVVGKVTGRLTAAALSDQQRERRGCLSLYVLLFSASPALAIWLSGFMLVFSVSMVLVW